ncbi:14487_t:CDS:2, partial [Funneliformis caledonium]
MNKIKIVQNVEIPEDDPSFEFKDDKQCVRPQAARFRIYGCDENGNVVREIKLTDKNNSVDGINEYKPDDPKRNAVILAKTLVIKTVPNYLKFANHLQNGQKIMGSRGTSKICTGYSKYCVVVSNYLGNQHPNDHRDVQWNIIVHPIFGAICRTSWVNKKAFIEPEVGSFFLTLWFLLDSPNDMFVPLSTNRKGILALIRIPKAIAFTAEYNGQAYDYFMPAFSGNNGDLEASSPDTLLADNT